MAQPAYQFPAATLHEALNGTEAGAVAVTLLHIVQDADGRYVFATSRADAPPGTSEVFIVKDTDGRDALNTSSTGAQGVAYFSPLNAAVL